MKIWGIKFKSINLDEYIASGHGTGSTFEHACEKEEKSKIPFNNAVRDFIASSVSNSNQQTRADSVTRQLNTLVNEIQIYQLQRQKFIDIINRIDEGIENFYPPQAKSLFEEYVLIIDHFLVDMVLRANDMVAELRDLVPNFRPPIF
jgi:hypothetical protein